MNEQGEWRTPDSELLLANDSAASLYSYQNRWRMLRNSVTSDLRGSPMCTAARSRERSQRPSLTRTTFNSLYTAAEARQREILH